MNISRITPITFIFAAVMLICGCDKSYEDEVITDQGGIRIEGSLWLDANGGHFKDNTTLGIYGQESIIPIREGFTFSHWNSETDGSGDKNMVFKDHSLSYINESMTMYAQWTPSDGNCNIVFDPGIPDGIRILENLPKGAVISLPDGSQYSEEPRTFVGWVDAETSTLHKDTFTVEKTTKLNILWNQNSVGKDCSILFAVQEGEIIDPISGESTGQILGSDCGIIEFPEAIRKGYKLAGWTRQLYIYYPVIGGLFYSYPGTYEINQPERFTPVWEEEP